MINPQIEESWKKELWDEFQKPYFSEIKNFLQKEKSE
jgi:uracil DNA glycosylase